ncbi:MAG: pyridoxamine 5'-phosphate oxidase family protein [Fimbriimonadaceae bacterium]|nr:pyridoxamine 5'-phosphate oxidase family protein [Chthonomonadaceae bacterium]MCO5296255.1 pyridoxamine 5'-phosphate oxidase family protein [Fimbriimonadaceae bacterium]
MTRDPSSSEIPGGYHDGSRQLQDRFDSRRIADRLEQVTAHTVFTDGDREFIARSSMFFFATANQEGWPECSYKGGMPGFVRVLDTRTLAFPDYDGNGMFRSLGNVAVNPRVGLLFLDFERPARLRINGLATLHEEDPLLSEFPGAQLIVRVRAERIFPNCPRYIHRLRLVEHSVYAPTHDRTPPEPEWKEMEEFRDALPGTSDRRAETT